MKATFKKESKSVLGINLNFSFAGKKYVADFYVVDLPIENGIANELGNKLFLRQRNSSVKQKEKVYPLNLGVEKNLKGLDC